MPKFGAGNKGTFEITAGVSSIATEETEAVNTAADLLSLLAAISEFDKVVGETLTAGTATGRTTFGTVVEEVVDKTSETFSAAAAAAAAALVSACWFATDIGSTSVGATIKVVTKSGIPFNVDRAFAISEK
jgi:fluoride ion exporter CrcB/FEX